MEEKNIDNNLEKLNDKKPIEETQIIMPQKKKGMSKSARKYLIYIILIVSVTALTLYYLLKEDPKAVFDKLASADIRYVLIFVGLILLYAFIGGLNLMILSKQIAYPRPSSTNKDALKSRLYATVIFKESRLFFSH